MSNWRQFSTYYYDESYEYNVKNVSDFGYSRGSGHEVKHQGFINNYAKTNPENDFNTYAEILFAEPEKIRMLSEAYPLIKTKLQYVKSIYRNYGYTGKFPDET